MNVEQLRPLKDDELQNELERLRRELFDLRAQAVTEKLADPTQISKTKRTIARILTILRERNVTDVEQQQAHLTAQAAKR